MKNKTILLSLAITMMTILTVNAQTKTLGLVDGTPYRINQWDYKLGNHRVLLQVDETTSRVIKATILWRRRAFDATKLDIVIVDPQNNIVKNKIILRSSRETVDLQFEPTGGKGLYAVYYQIPDYNATRKFGIQGHFTHTIYKKHEKTAANNWFEKVQEQKNIPAAKVAAFEALERFGPDKLKSSNSFYPMELIATAKETQQIINAHAGQSFVLFPEAKEYPIRMKDDLPYRWITHPPKSTFDVKAKKGQYLAFQVGVFALKEVAKLNVTFSHLTGSNGQLIRNENMTCFNLGGNDWNGNHFTKTVNVSKGKIQPLWCGIDIAADVAPGTYQGIVTITSEQNKTKQSFNIRLQIENQTIANHGDNDPWNLSRLNWLNSKIGIDDNPVPPYTAIQQADNNTFKILGRTITIGKFGLPSSAISYISMDQINKQGREILASPISLMIATKESKQKFSMTDLVVTKKTRGEIKFQTTGNSKQFSLACKGTLESDGYMRYSIALTAKTSAKLEDIVLSIPFKKEVAKYAMGKFGTSGYMPNEKTVPIKNGLMYNVVWGGDYNAGLGCWLKNKQDQWNADNASKTKVPLLKNWENNGQGFYKLVKNNKAVVYEIHNGKRTLKAGETLQLDFALVVTPFKPLTDFRWTKRIYHPSYSSMPSDEKAKPANIINLHHATVLNPYINYPFIANDRLKETVDKYHRMGKKVKIYYTIRELSVDLPELWAMRSLGDEIYIKHDGYLGGLNKTTKYLSNRNNRFDRSGFPWMAEHLVTDYRVRWHSHIRDRSNPKLSQLIGHEIDASISVHGLSRWHNYYLEGLKWAIQNIGIDGLYLDGIGYDREIMKRVRKTMHETGKPCTIDFHGAIHNAWMTHAPYVESIWFGEGAKYQLGSDYWLVEVSGIPFGVSGGILKGDGYQPANHFRGMVFGITRRIGWSNSYSAQYIWKLLDEFEIKKAKQLGYWDANCPVKSPVNNIKVSVYQKKNEKMLVVASWSKKEESIKLDIDWNALGLNPKTARAYLPAIEKYQKAGNIDIKKIIKVPATAGLIIIVTDKKESTGFHNEPSKLFTEDCFFNTDSGIAPRFNSG